ncbi:uncharacterized protein LOC110881719 [Helianthus annuus]|uniref:uncharacterized protein LOC110881719 n=1 Tax=Helianthus annuus TaxID=4232 RepID=UPI000B8FBF62|nr:uncharacterized protein LOC110881719 [Helianthus annuus]
MDQSMLAYTQILGMSPQFFHGPHGFASMGGSQASQEETEPDIETVPEIQAEPVAEASQRGKRSHKKEPNAPRRNRTYLTWSKNEEYVLARAWLDISEDHEVGELRDKDSISSKWTDINQKCHQFQEVFQRTRNKWDSGQNDTGILTRALKEYNQTGGVFTYLNCWELLRGSPKWSNVHSMTSNSIFLGELVYFYLTYSLVLESMSYRSS